MAKKQRDDDKPRVDAEFIKTFNPEFTFEIMRNTIKGRSLNIGHYAELKTMFPKWDGLSIGALIADYSPEALIEVCWLGVRDLNDFLPTKEHLVHTINGNTFDGWTIAWQKMTGLGTDSPEEPDIKKKRRNIIRNWGFIASMMARHYGYKIDDLKELTFEQVNTYLINLNFVLEMSGDLGRAPEAQPPTHELIDFARKCGITVPYDVHYDMIMSKKEIED